MTHPEKYTSKPILSAQTLLDRMYPASQRKAPPKTILIIMNKTVLNFAKALIWGKSSRRTPPNVITPNYFIGGAGLLGNTGVGGAGVVSYLEYLAAWGVQQMVLIGTAGSLTTNVSFGDIVVPSQSYRDDAVSNHYLPAAEWAHPSLKLNQSILKSLKQFKKSEFRSSKPPSIYEAAVWTTPAPFRETQAELRDYAARGMVAVEMETASLFAAAQVLKVKAAAVLVISDSLASGSHQVAPNQSMIDQQLQNVTRNLIRLFKD